jgi:Lon protease (S16) C-terminal proteolytic domain
LRARRAGQVWAISPGGQDEAAGLYRIEINEGPGSGVRILNQSPPAPFRESVRIAEQNLYARSVELVGDRNPREHEFTVQLRSFDVGKSGANTGVSVLLALVSALLGKPLKGGMAVVGGINLGGSIEPVRNPVDIVEHALSKGASTVLMPVSCRRALVDLSDDVATKVQVLFYSDSRRPAESTPRGIVLRPGAHSTLTSLPRQSKPLMTRTGVRGGWRMDRRSGSNREFNRTRSVSSSARPASFAGRGTPSIWPFCEARDFAVYREPGQRVVTKNLPPRFCDSRIIKCPDIQNHNPRPCP